MAIAKPIEPSTNIDFRTSKRKITREFNPQVCEQGSAMLESCHPLAHGREK
jgi:hypothetical protein